LSDIQQADFLREKEKEKEKEKREHQMEQSQLVMYNSESNYIDLKNDLEIFLQQLQ